MPSPSAMLLRLQMHLAKPIVRFAGINAARKAQDNLGKISARILESKVTYRDVSFPEFSASWAEPLGCAHKDTHAVLYLHGGGYTAGGLDYAKGFGGVLAAETGLKFFCVAYRLAP